jgi:hypothetical protein
MSTSQNQIDDLLDTRAEIRMLRKELLKRKIAYQECKSKLTAASTRLETL